MDLCAVYDLVRRLRRRSGIDFDPHWLRHTAATRMLRDGIGLEVVATLLGRGNVTTTAATYGHLTVEDVAMQSLNLGLRNIQRERRLFRHRNMQLDCGVEHTGQTISGSTSIVLEQNS